MTIFGAAETENTAVVAAIADNGEHANRIPKVANIPTLKWRVVLDMAQIVDQVNNACKHSQFRKVNSTIT